MILYTLIFCIITIQLVKANFSQICEAQFCLYWDSSKIRSLTDAQNVCSRENLTLLELRNGNYLDTVNMTLKNLTLTTGNGKVWLNLKRVSHDWMWVDGTLANIEFLRQFNSSDSSNAVVRFNDGQFVYAGMNSNMKFHVACQFLAKTQTCQSPPCVQLFDNLNLTWYQSRNYCLKLGGDLLIVNTSNPVLAEKFNEFVNHYYWVGLMRQSFHWQSDNSFLTVSNWMDGQPNYNVDCVDLPALGGDYLDYSWESSPCDASGDDGFQVVCYKYSSSTSSSSSSPSHTIVTSQLWWAFILCIGIRIIMKPIN